MANRQVLLTLLSFVASFLYIQSSTAAQPPSRSLTLAWNRSASAQIAGYRMYFGTGSQVYTNTLDIGNSTTATVTGLLPGTSYFFAVTAYDAVGLESAFSNELSYTVPDSAVVHLQVSQSTGAALSGSAPAGFQYEVQRSEDLQNWRALGTVTADDNGNFQFTDAIVPGRGLRCYRLHQVSP
jgi:hypothetical protein